MNAPSPWPPTVPPAPSAPRPGGSSDGPILFVAVGCAGLAFLSLCVIGIGAMAWGMARSSGPVAFGGAPGVRLRGQITSYAGSAPLGPGTSCELPIEQVVQDDGTIWCHVRLSCGGFPLYGTDDNGFFPCTITPSSGGYPGRVTGQDFETTSSDRDGAFSVNSDLRTFEAHDDGAGANGFFVVVGTITAVE